MCFRKIFVDLIEEMSYDMPVILINVHEVFGLADVTCYDQMAELTDSQLSARIADGDPNAFSELTARYLTQIKARAARLRSTMLEMDDLCQEGLMGLLSAARTYDASGGASFKTYAGVCIGNRMIMACRSAAGRKNSPLKNFVSLSEQKMDLDMPDTRSNPESMLIDQENVEQLRKHMKNMLTQLEQQVLMLYLGGSSYGQIAAQLGITPKVVDNALQRARVKLKKLFE